MIAYLFIGFAKLSNDKLPFEEEVEIKRKMARWMDLSYKNVEQYELVMKESLEWFNETPVDSRKDTLIEVAKLITLDEFIDREALSRILSELRDISVSDGKFEKGEKILHDKIAEVFGFQITTTDQPDEIKHVGFKYKQKDKKTKK